MEAMGPRVKEMAAEAETNFVPEVRALWAKSGTLPMALAEAEAARVVQLLALDLRVELAELTAAEEEVADLQIMEVSEQLALLS
jgi:hypothetical protein